MSGWDRKYGNLTSSNVSDDEYWALFNFVFSDSCSKRNTYKFGLVKSILDNLFNAVPTKLDQKNVYYISYEELFGKFAENYWNLVVKYHLHQMVKTTRSEFSAVERCFLTITEEKPELIDLEFESIDENLRKYLIRQIIRDCKKYVLGALYQDLEGKVYSFSISEYDGIYLGMDAYEFMMRYKIDLEKLNYYGWAKFLEKVNDDSVLVRVLDKLDLATPLRKDLSVYRIILQTEFEENNCFYCGRKLSGKIDVDHFIPWSFVKSDHLWNFVLACDKCNSKKIDKLPTKTNVKRIIYRNKKANDITNSFVREQFKSYDENRFIRLWTYASLSGYKIMTEE